MKRINLKVLAILIASVIGLLVGVVMLRWFQVSRNAGNLAKLAKQRLEEGKPAEAMALYGRYLGLRPEDDDAYAAFAKLVLARAESPDATRNDMGRAYNTLEAAVRRNPENDDLRRTLAKFQIRIGRSEDAREHLNILRERLKEGKINQPAPEDGPPGTPDPELLDTQAIELLMARSHLGVGDVGEAGKIVSEMIGFDLASRTFTDVNKGPVPTEAYVILAAILEEKLDDVGAATAVLQKLVEVHADDVQAWLARSNWYRQRGKLDAAAADIEAAMKIAPDDVNGLFAAFELALARKDLAAAKKHAQRALEVNPDDERAYRGLASVSMQEGAFAEAEQVLLDGVERLPGKASLLLMLADVLLQQNKLEEVGQAIDRIKELYGTTSPAVALLEGRLLVAQGKWADAKDQLEKVRPMVLSSPDLVRQVDLYLGQCHAQLDEYDAQLEVNRRVLVDDPGSLAARAGTASALAAAGKPDEALAEFEAIASALPPERIPTVPQVWYPLLQLRMQQQAKRPVTDRDWSSVDSLLDQLEQSPDVSSSQIALLRADTLVRKGEQATARELLEEETTRHPENSQAWAALITLVTRTSGIDDAEAVIAKLPAEVADSAIMLTIRGQIASQRGGDAGKAELAALAKRAEELPDAEATSVLAALAGLQFTVGDIEMAEQLWRTVAKRNPEDIRAREALLELAIGRGAMDDAARAAEEVAAVAGRDSARAKLAAASVKVFEVRHNRDKRAEAGEPQKLSDEENRRLDEARGLLIEAETERPRWGQVQSLFAEIDSLRGDMQSAVDRYKKAIEFGPANAAIVRRLVAILYSLNRLDEAQATLGDLGSGNETGMGRISAEMQLRAGKLEEAVKTAERTVREETATADDLLWFGVILERAGQQDRAGEVLLKATEKAPERPDVWLTLFSQQLAAGRKAPARRSLEKAASLQERPQREITLAQGLESLGEVGDAERMFREAVAGAPDNLEAQRGLAAFLLRAGQIAPARETVEKMLNAPDSPTNLVAKAWARRTLAELIADRGNFRDVGKAMSLLDANIDEKGNVSIDDVLLKVKLLASRPEPESWKKAIQELENLARRQPLVTGQRIMLAQLLEKVGRWSEGRDELVAVVAAPTAPPAYVALLVEKLIAHGELSAVRPWLARLVRATPESAITLALEAKLAIAENNRELAKEAARKLMPGGVVSGSEPGQLAAVATLMEQLGFPKAADKVLSQFAEMSADGVIARAEFLGRQKRVDEALELLDSRWNDLPLERLLTTSVQIARVQDDPAAVVERLDRWFTKARRIDPGSVVIQLLEGERASLAGRDSDAEKIYRDLMAISSLDSTQRAVVSNNLAFHLAEPDSVDEAKTLIADAIAELGPLPDLLDTRGMIHMAAGENAEAIKDFEQAVLQPTDVKFLHLAWAQFKAGDAANAKQSLEAGIRRGLSPAKLGPKDRALLKQLQASLGVFEPAVEPEG